LNKQGTQVNKIIQMLQPVQKQIKSAQRHPELLRQIQSQLKQLQKHISQIQKGMDATGKQKKKKSTLR
jgi:ferritin-like metal-binding protein YciE